MLPFRWRLIDAYFYLPHFGAQRTLNGDGEAPMEPAALRDRVLAALDEHAAGDGHLALLFHPFLLTVAPDALAVVSEMLARVGELCAGGSLRCLRMDEAAAELPADAGPPELDTR